jgi:hypothetical protein
MQDPPRRLVEMRADWSSQRPPNEAGQWAVQRRRPLVLFQVGASKDVIAEAGPASRWQAGEALGAGSASAGSVEAAAEKVGQAAVQCRSSSSRKQQLT